MSPLSVAAVWESESQRLCGSLARWTALMALGLLASTWRLWVGQSEFPSVPAASWLCHVPLAVDWIALGGLLLGLGAILLARPWRVRWAWMAILLCGSVLVCLNQHRLQPWFYQLLIFAAILSLAQPQLARQLLLWIAISIYLHSALGKFDFEFIHTVGQHFWHGMIDLLGIARAPDEETSPLLILLLPLSELLLTVGLAAPATRAVAGAAAIAFHVGLMLLLGPFGLNHSWGVLLWNLQFAGQAWYLFVRPAIEARNTNLRAASQTAASLSGEPASGQVHASSIELHGDTAKRFGMFLPATGNCLAALTAAIVIGSPVLERLGYWDHWTSWALYAPHSSRVEVWVAGAATKKLPGSLQRSISEEAENSLWYRLPLEQWSLAETGSPIYPQARFQMAVAVAIAQRLESEFYIRAIVRGVAARRDGQRVSREYQGSTAIKRAADKDFWGNTQPRSTKAIKLPLRAAVREGLGHFAARALPESQFDHPDWDERW